MPLFIPQVGSPAGHLLSGDSVEEEEFVGSAIGVDELRVCGPVKMSDKGRMLLDFA